MQGSYHFDENWSDVSNREEWVSPPLFIKTCTEVTPEQTFLTLSAVSRLFENFSTLLTCEAHPMKINCWDPIPSQL